SVRHVDAAGRLGSGREVGQAVRVVLVVVRPVVLHHEDVAHFVVEGGGRRARRGRGGGAARAQRDGRVHHVLGRAGDGQAKRNQRQDGRNGQADHPQSSRPPWDALVNGIWERGPLLTRRAS